MILFHFYTIIYMFYKGGFMDKKKDFFKIKIKSSNLYNNLKKLNKKDIFLSCILVILFITIFVLSNYIFQRQHLKRKFENGVISSVSYTHLTLPTNSQV